MSQKKGWLSWLGNLLGAILGLGLLGLFLAWMGGAFHEKVAPSEREVPRIPAKGRPFFTALRKKTTETIAAVGSVQPRRRTEVAGQLLANILEVRVQPGDRVKPGDLLIVLDNRELLAQEREAAASLTAAEADLITRKAELDRLRSLRQSGAVSAIEYSKVEGAYKVGESQVQRARESINRLAVQLSYTKITAGTQGVVADRFADPGDLAAPGKPLLLVYDPSDLELHINIPETVSHLLRPGQSLAFHIDAAGLSSQATVREVVPQAQQASRSVLVKLTLPPHPGANLLPGMFSRLNVPVGETTGIWIPGKGIHRAGQIEWAEVVDKTGHLERRFIRTGQTQDDQVEILTGLSEGETIALPSS